MVVLTEKTVTMRAHQERLEHIRQLNLWGQELTDVSILAKMPGLEVLALPVNNLTSLKDIRKCTNLRELYLRKNQITRVEDIHYLQGLRELRVLSLEENPCVTAPNYRTKVLQCLPQLTKLDSTAVTEKEVRNAKLLLQLGDDGSALGAEQAPEMLRPPPTQPSQGLRTTPRRALSSRGDTGSYRRSTSLPNEQIVPPFLHHRPQTEELTGQRAGTNISPTPDGAHMRGSTREGHSPKVTPSSSPFTPNSAGVSPRSDYPAMQNGIATSSPRVLYAVLTLLGELDGNALKVVKADAEQRLSRKDF